MEEGFYFTAIILVATAADDGNFSANDNAVWLRQMAISRHYAGEEAVEALVGSI